MNTPPPVKVFISYAHADRQNWLEPVHEQLKGVQNLGVIDVFQDDGIEPGEPWAPAIQRKLDEADIVVLIVTPAFLASANCINVELERAMARHRDGTARIVPIIAEPCSYRSMPFAALEALPTDKDKRPKPLAEWKAQARKGPLAVIAEKIEKLAREIAQQRTPPQPEKQQAIAEVLERMDHSATEYFHYINQFTAKDRDLSRVSALHQQIIFDSSLAPKDDNWLYQDPIPGMISNYWAAKVLDEWFNLKVAGQKYKPWSKIEMEWKEILSDEVHCWKGKDRLEVESHPFLRNMYHYILAGRADDPRLTVSTILLKFCGWSSNLKKLIPSLPKTLANRMEYFVRNIFYHADYGYLSDHFIFRGINIKGKYVTINYNVDRKIIIARSGPSICTFITGVPYPENPTEEQRGYLKHVDKWLGQFQLGRRLQQFQGP